MTLAQEAYVEFAISKSKQKIRDDVLWSARNGNRSIQLPCLPTQSEHVESLIKWMKSEGLNVEFNEEKRKPTGFGAQDDDELVTVTWYVISW